MWLHGLLEALTQFNKVLILCHQNADPDSLGAATALSRLLATKLPKITFKVVAPSGINKSSRNIARYLPSFEDKIPQLETADAVILVDTNTLSQLGELGDSLRNCGKPLAFIDHHAIHPDTADNATIYIVDEDASSASEMVYSLYKEAKLHPDVEAALGIFLGITYDTRHFALARSNTFKIAAELVELGIIPEKSIPLLSVPMDSSERLARLKAAQRLSQQSIGRWCIVTSEVGSYQASAARALVALGADVAVVGGKRKDKLKISLRSSIDFSKISMVHLGRDIATALGESLKGMGGGHRSSAGFNGEGDLETAFRLCFKLLQKSLGSHSSID